MTARSGSAHFFKSHSLERGYYSHELIARRIGVHRIRFHNVCVLPFGVFDRRADKLSSDTAPSQSPGREEACYRPNVHRRVHRELSAAQFPERFSRRDRTPSRRLLVDVSQNSYRRFIFDPTLERRLFGGVVRALSSRHSAPDHAPAILGPAPRFEKALQILPAVSINFPEFYRFESRQWPGYLGSPRPRCAMILR